MRAARTDVTLRFEQNPDGWWTVSVPGVQGAYTQGRTRASARASLMRLLPALEKAKAHVLRSRRARPPAAARR